MTKPLRFSYCYIGIEIEAHDSRNEKASHMINLWLELPPYGIFATLALLYFGLAGLLCWLTYKSRLSSRIRSLSGLVAPFFSAVAVLFALLTGFLAIDVGERNKRAHTNVQTEAGALRNLHTLSVASAPDMQAIRTAIKDYATSVTTDDWQAMSHESQSRKTDHAYDALLREVSNPNITRDAGQPVHEAMLSATVEAGKARNARLSISTDRTNHLKWLSVLILGLITQIAIALVHLGQTGRAFMTGQIVFASAAIVALGIIALQETPFDGAFRVTPLAIEKLQALPVSLAPPAD